MYPILNSASFMAISFVNQRTGIWIYLIQLIFMHACPQWSDFMIFALSLISCKFLFLNSRPQYYAVSSLQRLQFVVFSYVRAVILSWSAIFRIAFVWSAHSQIVRHYSLLFFSLKHKDYDLQFTIVINKTRIIVSFFFFAVKMILWPEKKPWYICMQNAIPTAHKRLQNWVNANKKRKWSQIVHTHRVESQSFIFANYTKILLVGPEFLNQRNFYPKPTRKFQYFEING